jgi:hypothetical protein
LAWVPIDDPNRYNKGYRNRAGGGILAAVILLLVFGLLFFVFFNRFDGFMMPIWFLIGGFGIFFVIIVVIATIAVSMSQTNNKPKGEYNKAYQYQYQRQSQQSNPYRIRDSISKHSEEPIKKEIKREIPVLNDINYCRYCGSKIDRDAVFCHMCGIKL